MSTTPVTTPNPPTTGTTTSGLPSSQSLNNMFLQLLVAQLQNQDPLDPQDPSQFVGQLAQFSELSEVTSIYQLLQQVVPGASTPPTGSVSGGSNSAERTASLPAPANSSGTSSASGSLDLGNLPGVAFPAPTAV